MELLSETVQENKPRHPWNKGKLIGAKPPLRAKHVWAISVNGGDKMCQVAA